MALISRIATVTLTTATGTRTFTATADIQDTAAGGSVVVTVADTPTGAAPPSVPDTLTLLVRIDNTATNIITYSAVGAKTFVFTDTGAAGGVNRCGTVRLRIEAARTAGSLATNYTVNSDDTTGEVLPAGMTVTTRDQGWIRGTTTLVEAISNVALGGIKSSPAEHDESLFVRTTTGAISYVARTLTVAVSDTTPALSSATNSTTAVTRDVTFTNVTDERFPAAATVVGVAITVESSALTGLAAWTYTTTTDDTLSVDPRVTASHHLQIDDNVFALSKAVDWSMLATESGFLATRVVGARGTGINGLTVNQTLTPAKPGTAINASSATATRDTQAGWTDLLSWTSSKPAGSWNKVSDITAPADIDADTYLSGNTATFVLLSPDPRISLFTGAGGLAVLTEHWNAGKSLTIGCALLNGAVKTAFLAGSAKCTLLRFNGATGTTEYLNAAFEWVTGDTAFEHAMTPSAGDAKLALITISAAQTGTTTPANQVWGAQDIFVSAVAKTSDGTPYFGKATVGVLGTANKHSGQAFDATGLFA